MAKKVKSHQFLKRPAYAKYRPFSVLPDVSKILEKIVALRLAHILDKNAIITNTQYGFRSSNSTVKVANVPYEKLALEGALPVQSCYVR